MRYQGPRTFSPVVGAPGLGEELRTLAAELDRLYRAQQDGNPRRWGVVETLRRSGPLVISSITPVETAGTAIDLTLPAWSAALIGLELAIERVDNVGLLRVLPPASPKLLKGLTTPLTISNTVGLYLLVCTPSGWAQVNDA